MAALSSEEADLRIDRSRTAMSRDALSRPFQQAMADGLLDGRSIFDYGCGRGDDLRTLRALGLRASGWDPAHSPDAAVSQADVVNLGYVINVIENRPEREDALRGAWQLATSILIVSARLVWERTGLVGRPHADGLITSAGTFQKFYEHEELKAWVERTLGATATTAAPGILYVFREPQAAQQLLARTARRGAVSRRGVAELIREQHRAILDPLESFVAAESRLPNPSEIEAADLVDTFGSLRAAFAVIRQATGAHRWSHVELGPRRKSTARFEDNLEALQPLIDFVTERGRLPRDGELVNEAELAKEFGSVRGAFSLVRRVTGPAPWQTLESRARENFLVYSALSAFGGRPKFGQLPADLQYDAKDLFGSYAAACASADELLHSIADIQAINHHCEASRVGKLTGEALYVHVDYVPQLTPLLRVYEGAARHLTGNVDDATLVKLNRIKPQVSYLVYPTFVSDPHPALEASVVAKFTEMRMKHRYFGERDNPPILHRKDAFIPCEHPDWSKYDRLTRQEERAGLLDRPDIGTRSGWERVLAQEGYRLHGHQLRRSADGDPTRRGDGGTA